MQHTRCLLGPSLGKSPLQSVLEVGLQLPPPPAPPAACQGAKQEGSCPFFLRALLPTPFRLSPSLLTLQALALASGLPLSAPKLGSAIPCPRLPSPDVPLLRSGPMQLLCPWGVAPSLAHGQLGNCFSSRQRPLKQKEGGSRVGLALPQSPHLAQH